jgi:uncharacterized protein (TIGR01777 family)
VATVLLSGASGFVGFHLARSLTASGHRVVPLVRGRPSSEHTVAWNPEAGEIDTSALARTRAEIVVNLAGEPIAQRWTARRKRRIRDSRVNGTAVLSRAVARVSEKPAVLLSGSAIGYYGAHRGDELLDEEALAGRDFLADTARAWEEATMPASDAGLRVVLLRTGIVIGRGGGVLRRLLLPFRLGLGGRVGTGDQWMSWIALDDMVAAIRFLAERSTLAGAVNMVAPEPVRNAQFTRALARALHRPALLPIPRIALEIVFGTMADNTILASQRVTPKRLTDAGYPFRHPRLDDALSSALTR